jgi:hypothetical protein
MLQWLRGTGGGRPARDARPRGHARTCCRRRGRAPGAATAPPPPRLAPPWRPPARRTAARPRRPRRPRRRRAARRPRRRPPPRPAARMPGRLPPPTRPPRPRRRRGGGPRRPPGGVRWWAVDGRWPSIHGNPVSPAFPNRCPPLPSAGGSWPPHAHLQPLPLERPLARGARARALRRRGLGRRRLGAPLRGREPLTQLARRPRRCRRGRGRAVGAAQRRAARERVTQRLAQRSQLVF